MSTNYEKKRITIGTRGSRLALVQTQLFIDEVKSKWPDVECEIKVYVTQGDRQLDKELASFGGKGVFVSAIEEALQEGAIDAAVHSGKDLPMELADGLAVSAVLQREDVRDVLAVRKRRRDSLEVIGCGSIRRSVQLKALYPDAIIKPIRGNVPTRLDKVRSGEFDATVLAMAGLNRLGISEDDDIEFIPFDVSQMVPAGCQGIIAIETRKNDKLNDMLAAISHKETMEAFEIERGILKALNAGCSEPVGVLACKKDNEYNVRLFTADGEKNNIKEFKLQEGKGWEKYI